MMLAGRVRILTLDRDTLHISQTAAGRRRINHEYTLDAGTSRLFADAPLTCHGSPTFYSVFFHLHFDVQHMQACCMWQVFDVRAFRVECCFQCIVIEQ